MSIFYAKLDETTFQTAQREIRMNRLSIENGFDEEMYFCGTQDTKRNFMCSPFHHDKIVWYFKYLCKLKSVCLINMIYRSVNQLQKMDNCHSVSHI